MNTKTDTNKWRVEFQDDWVISNRTVLELHGHGYSVATLTQENKQTKEERRVYVLARKPAPFQLRHEVLLETTDPEELNNFINLILPPKTN